MNKLTIDMKRHLHLFILSLGISPTCGDFVTSKGVKIKASEIMKYITKAYAATYGTKLVPQAQAYIESILLLPYDFENVPYKAYLKTEAEKQEPKAVKNLRDNYDNYLESIQDKNTAKQCIYISGTSGSGKTTYAKILALKNYPTDEIFITSGGEHPFDEYHGEKVIIVDDFRDSVMSYNDLLRLLDNHTTSNVGARYHNKNLARCELIILTSVKQVSDLYKGIDEERFQLYRRVKYVKIEGEQLALYEYSNEKGAYLFKTCRDIGNELEEYKQTHKVDEKKDILSELFKPEIIEINEDELPF